MKAVVLAGGKGTRLKPYATVFPKPLMPVGDKPILEIILRQLKSYGFEEIILAVGHLAELVMTFFGDGSKYGLNIRYSREEKPLGTAGPLSLIRDNLTETFLMMNGDVLTTLDYSELVSYHRKNKSIATIALKKREVYIDFGVVEVDKKHSNIVGYVEKPTVSHLVSMGVYVFEPQVLEYVEPGKPLDFPDLIKKLLSRGRAVKGYIFDDYWLDIGIAEDYEKANAEIEEVYDRLKL